MTQEDKQLLLKDLCTRLPYGVICRYAAVIPLLGEALNYGPLQEIRRKGEYFTVNGADCLYDDIKPYLRPMSSMTEEERDELYTTMDWYGEIDEAGNVYTKGQEKVYKETFYEYTDWLISHHFDYRGLIEKGLALEASEEMYRL